MGKSKSDYSSVALHKDIIKMCENAVKQGMIPGIVSISALVTYCIRQVIEDEDDH